MTPIGTKVTLTCAGCGARFARVTKKGRPPKWCSTKCRRTTLYGGRCEDCGAVTDGSKGASAAPRKCARCSLNELCKQNHAASQLHREEIERLWADGLTIQGIADKMGCKASSMGSWIVRLRREGADLPYRKINSTAGREAQRASGRRLAAKRLAA